MKIKDLSPNLGYKASSKFSKFCINLGSIRGKIDENVGYILWEIGYWTTRLYG